MGTNYRDLLGVTAFRNLWVGQAISQLGDSLYYLVFLFMVDRLTGDPRMVGITGVAQTLPFLLLSPYAGVVADRADRRQILLRADLLSAATLAAFAFLVWRNLTPPPWTLIATGALLSSINVFFAPAKGAAIPQIVPPGLLPSANALSMATQNLMPMIGVALSGIVLAALYLLSPTYFFLSAILLNALSFALSALFIRRLPTLQPERVDTATVGAAGQGIQDLRDGFTYLSRQPVLWMMLLLNLLVQLAISPFMLVYVQVNRQWFGGGYGTLAACEVSFFVGVVVCSVFIERLRVSRVGLAFIGGMAGVGVTVMFMAFSVTVLPFAFWNLIAGLAFPFAQIPMTTYIQRTVPDAFQGRVNSVLAMTGWGIQPLGIGLGSLLLAAVGPAWLLVLMGGAMTLAALGGLFARPFRAAALPEPV
ncbi:MAG: MFS transporter [Cytophagales bacterium]|nr:MFS transporter [Armatimonadota bacterium]